MKFFCEGESPFDWREKEGGVWSITRWYYKEKKIEENGKIQGDGDGLSQRRKVIINRVERGSLLQLL